MNVKLRKKFARKQKCQKCRYQPKFFDLMLKFQVQKKGSKKAAKELKKAQGVKGNYYLKIWKTKCNVS